MRRAKLLAILLSCALFPLLSGCFWTPEFYSIVAEVQRQAPEARFERDIQLNLGPTSIGLARTILGVVPDDREVRLARDILGEIRHIKIAVYKTYNLHSARQISMPEHLKKMIGQHNWKTVVRAHEDNEFVMVVYKPHRQSITEMFVFSLDQSELVLVQLEGRLDHLFDRVMEEHSDVGDLFLTGK